MTPIAFVDAGTWVSIGFHAVVFSAVVVIVLAIQWLLDRRGGRGYFLSPGRGFGD